MENTNIKVERAKMNMTQQELADKTGLDRQSIHLIEKKKTDLKLSTACKLARFFNIPIDILFKENIDNN